MSLRFSQSAFSRLSRPYLRRMARSTTGDRYSLLADGFRVPSMKIMGEVIAP